MAARLRKRRDISEVDLEPEVISQDSVPSNKLNTPTSDIEVYAKEVLNTLINDNLPPTPSNYILYFDRLLEDKSETLRKQVNSILEFDQDNDDDKSLELEKYLKKGFQSVKSILGVTANMYKNMALMTKILDKRKAELENDPTSATALNAIINLEEDVSKLNGIIKKQITQMKTLYDDTASIVKDVENETIFDNRYGIYNKRYLLTKLDQEIKSISEFNHKSTVIMLELSKSLEEQIESEKVLVLMTKTIARLLMKTSRRSDIVAHYSNGIFAMILKHTDINSAKKASERLCDLVSNSNFFLAEKEIELKIAVGIAPIKESKSVEETILCALDAMQNAYNDDSIDFSVCEA